MWNADRHATIDEIASAQRPPFEPAAQGELQRGPSLEGLRVKRPDATPAPGAWTLEVRVLGLPADARPPTYVSVMPVADQRDREDHAIQVVEDETPGHVLFDVTDLVHAKWSRLRVRVRHADAFPGSTVVEVPDIDVQERGGRLTALVAVKPGAVLTGRVVDPSGRPVAQAAVLVEGLDFEVDHAAQSDPNPKGYSLLSELGGHPLMREQSAITDLDGRFRVLARGAERIVLLAGWAAEGAPTVSPPIAISVGRSQDVGDLRLGPLEHLRGHVRGPDLVAGRLTPVRAQRLGVQRELFEGLMRTPSGAVQGKHETRIDAAGHFDFSPVDDAVWRVTAQGEDQGAELSHAVARRARALVRGPAETVALDVRRTLLDIRVHNERGPLDGALVLVQGPDALVCRTFDKGRAPVVLLHETTYAVVAWHWDHGAERRTVTMGAPGTVARLELTLPATPTQLPTEMAWVPTGPATPTLVVDIQGWDDARLPAVLRIRDERGEELRATWVEQGRGVTWLVKDVLPALADAWLTSRLPPGAYQLEVEAPLHRTELVPFEIGANGRAADRIDLRLTPR